MPPRLIRLPLMLDIQAEVLDGQVQAVNVVGRSGKAQDITEYLDEDQIAAVQIQITGERHERTL